MVHDRWSMVDGPPWTMDHLKSQPHLAHELQRSHQIPGDALALHVREDSIITATNTDAADNALRLRVTQNPVLAMTAANTAPFHSPHRNIKAVVDEKSGVDNGRPCLELMRNCARLRLTG